jgi:hypothetical protein
VIIACLIGRRTQKGILRSRFHNLHRINANHQQCSVRLAVGHSSSFPSLRPATSWTLQFISHQSSAWVRFTGTSASTIISKQSFDSSHSETPARLRCSGGEFGNDISSPLGELFCTIRSPIGSVHKHMSDVIIGLCACTCKSFGIESPKAHSVTGLDMKQLTEEKRFREIAEYNLRDLQATAELFRRWERFLNV